MAKTEVYSWRLHKEKKMALEHQARLAGTTVSEVLDSVTQQWLDKRASEAHDDEEEQKRLHAAAAKFIGSLSGGNPKRSTTVREAVRRRLEKRYGR